MNTWIGEHPWMSALLAVSALGLVAITMPVKYGDLLARITHSLGIAPCDACERRRRWLNSL